MNILKRIFSIWICKFLILAGKVTGRKGSSTPGLIALKIYKNLLSDLAAQVKKEIIAVCGTNGKTTTNNLIYKILSDNGYSVVCNNIGANMLPGVVTAFVSKANLFGKINADYAAIEIDEASATKVFDYLKPTKMVVTNLFRDQLDRYGEIDITIKKLNEALKKVPGITLILNGDDPLTTSLAGEYKSIFYGIAESVLPPSNETKEGRFCVFCKNELSYKYYHYSQLGNYYCENCGFCRPHLDFEAENVDISNGLNFTVGTQKISVNYKGFYNIYNILAAYSVASLLNIKINDINNIFADYKPQIGRMEQFNINGKQVIFNLSKNPAGFNQAISTMLADPRKKDVVIVINDNAQDGIDISWIWDVDFEKTNSQGFNKFTASGKRAEDVNIRLKYCGICADKIYFEKDIKKGIEKLLPEDGEVLYVLVNYTAIFETQNILKAMENNR